MPTVNITETEINPTYIAEGGGGRRTVTETEIPPTYTAEGGGGRRRITETEIRPILEEFPFVVPAAPVSAYIFELLR